MRADTTEILTTRTLMLTLFHLLRKYSPVSRQVFGNHPTSLECLDSGMTHLATYLAIPSPSHDFFDPTGEELQLTTTGFKLVLVYREPSND